MLLIFSFSIATFILHAVQSVRVDVKPNNNFILMEISCGGHQATNCSECPQGHGESWCHGDCKWVGNSPNGSDDECKLKSDLRAPGIADLGIVPRAKAKDQDALDEPPLYDYEKGGMCCKKRDRWRQKMYRWFYYIPKPEAKGRQGKPHKVEKCPVGWKESQGNCAGMGAYNLASYEENTDWVYCCKQADKAKYTFYESDSCSQVEAFFSCNNWECIAKSDTKRSKWSCPKGYKKYVNSPSTYYCKTKPPEHLGITDLDCAGFLTDCPKKQCMFQSKQTTSIDCTGQCELAKTGNGTQGWYSKKKPSMDSAGKLAINCAVMLLSILSTM